MGINRRDIVQMPRRDNDLAILRVTARFVSQALREAEDITMTEGEKS
jgi:hypothetical protein